MPKEGNIEIERKEIKRFFEFFKENAYRADDDRATELIKTVVKRIFQIEVEELGYKYDPEEDNDHNEFELRLVFDKTITSRASHAGERRLVNKELKIEKPKITYNLEHMCEELKEPDVSTRLTACKDFFKTVFHELQHHRQEMMAATRVSNKESLMFARDLALRKLLNSEFYSLDGSTGNYAEFSTELDANEQGYGHLLDIMGEQDEETELMRDIESGYLNTSGYKINTTSRDNSIHYRAEGVHAREDIATQVLDDLICVQNHTELLKLYPILQKEYNLDGSKKTATELVTNLIKEIDDVSKRNDISEEDKQEIIQDAKQMYYELIYNALQIDTYSQTIRIKVQIGKEKTKSLFEDMAKYFQEESERKIEKSSKMAAAQETLGEFVLAGNDGTIQIYKDGKLKIVSVNEFIDTIDEKLLYRKIQILDSEPMTAKEYIKRYCFRALPQDGIVTLKNGEQITATQYVEEYMIKDQRIERRNGPRTILKENVQSEDPWKLHEARKTRILEYYKAKVEFANGVRTILDGKYFSSEDIARTHVKVRITRNDMDNADNWLAKLVKDETEEKITDDER